MTPAPVPDPANASLGLRRVVAPAVLVASLGYFVDVYDIIIFSVVRTRSLQDLGVLQDALLPTGVHLLNLQMSGMLLGGLLWGIVGDKRGRLAVLFGSIVLYSLANIANGFVDSVIWYAGLRFIAGIGLAGELGGGLTLISEVTRPGKRGYATAIAVTVGVAGGLAAAFAGARLPWRSAYIVGGVAGLLIVSLRAGLHESGLYKSIASSQIPKGDLRLIFRSPARLLRYISCILVGLPMWYVLGILVTLSPEIGRALGVDGVSAARSLSFYTAGNIVGSIASGVLSQWLKSRKTPLAIFLLIALAAGLRLLTHRLEGPQSYYLLISVLGFALGYWAVLATTAAEQFGTNLRATVATTVPNLVRGSTVPLTFLFERLRPGLGIVRGAEAVGVLCIVCALISVVFLRETFGRDLDFVERE